MEVAPSYDFCMAWDCSAYSDWVEGHVTGALWDIYDDDEDDYDVYSFGSDEIYHVLENYTNTSFNSWWTSWQSSGFSDNAVMSLYQNDIDYRSTASCADDAYEASGDGGTDDTCRGSVIAVGESQSHLHCDEDWVYFNPLPGATYRIETSNLRAEADTTLAVHQLCGSQLAFNDNYGDALSSRIDFTAPSSWRLYVRIRQSGGSYLYGEQYDVSVTCIADCDTDPIFQDGFENGGLTYWSSWKP
jgi:hypothetical protein